MLCAAFVAWLWSRYGHRVNLALFFQVTAVFLAVFVVQLAIYGFHELMEANLFTGSEWWHDATEPIGPDGRYGRYLSYLLVVMPVARVRQSGYREQTELALGGGQFAAPLVPFGVFLAPAAFATLLWGDAALEWLLRG